MHKQSASKASAITWPSWMMSRAHAVPSAGQTRARNLQAEARATAGGQYPFAGILRWL